MWFKWFGLLSMLLAGMDSLGQKSVTVYKLGPNDIVLDANMIRGQFGYSWYVIPKFMETPASRTAQLGNVKCEFRMISGAMDKYKNFVVYDALYTEMAMGKCTSEAYHENTIDPADREGKFAVAFNWGYDFYMGYRNKHWGLLAGIRSQWSMISIGDFSLNATAGGLDVFSFNYPIALRSEWRPFSHFEYRIIGTAWYSTAGNHPWNGCRLEVPTFPSSRYWIFVEYSSYRYEYMYLSTDPIKSGRTGILNVGIRFGSIF